MALAGYVTARWLHQAEPAITGRQVAAVTIGWAVGWLAGGLLFAMATQLPNKPLSGLLAVISLTAAGVIGGAATFVPLYRARSSSTQVPPGSP
jgi:hypothetical protein